MKKAIAIMFSFSLILLFIWGAGNIPPKESGSSTITEHIKLYSNGKLIGEWTGIGHGSMEGDTYRFKTEQGAFSKVVRIKGDFVVETLPN